MSEDGSMTEGTDNNKEIMELGHDPLPGYQTAFRIAVTVGALYLILAFSGVL